MPLKPRKCRCSNKQPADNSLSNQDLSPTKIDLHNAMQLYHGGFVDVWSMLCYYELP